MRFLIIYFFQLIPFVLLAQNNKQYGNADPIINIQFHYTYIEPGGDLSNRFGNIHNIGTGALYKTYKNWLWSAEASYQFGTIVKEPQMLINLTNSNGVILNTSGMPANYNVGQRGLSGILKGGKLFPISWKNRNSGIAIMLGVGMYYHKVNIATPRNDIPTLTEDLKKGYDRLTMGPATSQFIGYYFHSANKYYNGYIGFDFLQAFTKSVRGYNYDTRLPDTSNRLDLTFGIRVGWLIPIYLKMKNDQNEYEFK